MYTLDTPAKRETPCEGEADQSPMYETEQCIKFGEGYRMWHCDFVLCGWGEFNVYYDTYSDDKCTQKVSSSEVFAHNRCQVSADSMTAVEYSCTYPEPRGPVSNHQWCCSQEQEKCQYHTHYSACEKDQNCRWCNLTLASEFPNAEPMCQPNWYCIDRSTPAKPRFLGGDCWSRDCRIAAMECDKQATEGECGDYITFNGESCQWCKDNKVAECAYRPPWRCDVPQYVPHTVQAFIRYDRDQCPAHHELAAAPGIAPSAGVTAALALTAMLAVGRQLL